MKHVHPVRAFPASSLERIYFLTAQEIPVKIWSAYRRNHVSEPYLHMPALKEV